MNEQLKVCVTTHDGDTLNTIKKSFELLYPCIFRQIEKVDELYEYFDSTSCDIFIVDDAIKTFDPYELLTNLREKINIHRMTKLLCTSDNSHASSAKLAEYCFEQAITKPLSHETVKIIAEPIINSLKYPDENFKFLIELSDLIFKKKISEAKEFISKSKPQKVSTQNLYLMAQMYYFDNNFDESSQLLKQIVDSHPSFLNALSLLSQIYFRQNKFTDSYSLIKKALNISPDNKDRMKIAMDAAIKSRNYDDAIEISHNVYHLRWSDEITLKHIVAGLIVQGMYLNIKKDFLKAFECHKMGILLGNKNPKLYRLRNRALREYLKFRMNADMLEVIQKIIDEVEFEKELDEKFSKGMFYYFTKNWAKAVPLLEPSIGDDTINFASIPALIICYHHLKYEQQKNNQIENFKKFNINKKILDDFIQAFKGIGLNLLDGTEVKISGTKDSSEASEKIKKDADKQDDSKLVFNAKSIAELDIAQVLQGKSEDINMPDVEGNTVLHNVASGKLNNSVLAFKKVEGGFEQVSSEGLKLEKSTSKEAVLNIVEVSEDGKIAKNSEVKIKEVSKQLFLAGADVNAPNMQGQTPLMLAIENEFEDIIESLVEEGADLHVKDKNGKTVIDYTKASKNTTLSKKAESLFQKISAAKSDNQKIKTNENINKRNKQGQTGIMIAALRGLEDAVGIFLEQGANLELKDFQGKTSIFYAAMGGNENVISKMIEKKAKLDVKDSERMSALFHAVKANKPDAVKLLIKFGCDVEVKIKGQETPLLFASQNGLGDIVKILVEAGANTKHANITGQNALTLAQANNHLNIVEYLKTKT